MPERSEKLRRRAIVQALRVTEDAQAQARRPLEKGVLRQLLPYLEGQLLVGSADGDPLCRCDHTHAKTRQFLEQRGVWTDSLPQWLAEYGGFCDCEVMYNVFDHWDTRRLREPAAGGDDA